MQRGRPGRKEGENVNGEHFSPTISEMAQTHEYLDQLGQDDQQSLQTMSGGEDPTDKRIIDHNLLPSLLICHHVNLMPNSHVDQPQSEDSDQSHLSGPQSVIIDNNFTMN